MTSQMKTPAPAIVHKLVETFEKNLDEYRSSKNETELRREFLDKFFAALGWDVSNEKGYDEAHKEVIHEFSVEVAGQGKKADYAFRTGSDKFDFLVEAKKPSVKVETSQDAAFQIRRYGWSAKLPINILTDFEHLAVYDCRAKPSYHDKASVNRIMLVHFKDYVERWDEIVDIFSPEAVRKGSFAKYAEGMKGKKGTADVDDAFLQEIERWREMLAKNIALRNTGIDIAGLNYAVQMTIDRIVFLRICEERGIEPENKLLDITEKEGVYKELYELFKRADTKYNSGLFHFKKEKELVSRPDDLTPSLDIDDKVLKDIISNLYYPKSPYAFLYIPSDILGQVYERFLGKVIRLTEGHQAKVEEKPEVRKAGGVYYTPTYIVDYIVKNTVGKLVENKTPKEVASLKIVDPACGSGTFLLGAYQFLLDWHLNWYVTNEPEKWVKSKAILKVDKGYKLVTAKTKEILLNNIHGVDIDAQAVEVTKLSLLLKVLENAGGQLGLGMERVLPDLGNNIKCGNSLIGFDYFEGLMFPDEKELASVNPFDWRNEFKNVFARGGFDVVIGNPPYVRIQAMQEWASNQVEFFKTRYKAAGKGNYDIYGLFIERGLNLIKPDGLLCFITGSKWLQANYADSLREIVKNHVTSILNFNHNQVFENAFVNTCILLLSKKTNKFINYMSVDKVPDLSVVVSEIKENKLVTSLSVNRASLKTTAWHFGDSSSQAFIEKIRFNNLPLEDVCSRIYQGLKTSGDKIFLVEIAEGEKEGKIKIRSNQLQKEVLVESSLFKPLCRGSQVKRYYFIDEKRAILFPYRQRELIPEKELQQKYPLTYQYFLENRKTLEAREHGKLKGTNWYGYGRNQALDVVGMPKILTPDLARSVSFAWDSTGDVYFVGGAAGGYGLIPKPEWDYRYLLGLLNSRLLDYFIKSQSTQMESGFYSFEARFIRSAPIRFINSSNSSEKAQHDKIVSIVEQLLVSHKSLSVAQTPQEKERLERQIEVTDRSIDSLVYELYGLSDEEIRIVEGGSSKA